MTTPSPQPRLPGKSTEGVARLMEESSLGTVGARQLRDRATTGTVAAIRARAYFGDGDAGRAWWEENKRRPDALRRKADELAASGDHAISDVLSRLADGLQNTTPANRRTSAKTGFSAEDAMADLFSTHYRSLVSLAASLVRDVETAEQIVQDSFMSMYSAWPRLRDSGKALSYLRQSVVSRSHQRMIVDPHSPQPPPEMPSAGHNALSMLEDPAVAARLRRLPRRQREALVLRYYGDLSETDIATAMGISRGAVKSRTARAIASLRAVFERDL